MTNSKLRLNTGLRITVYVIELIVFYVLQQVPGLFPPILGASPYLVLSLAITVALLEPESIALGFGVLSGLFIDMATAVPMGSFAIIMAIVSCFISAIAQRKIHVTIMSAWFTALVASAVVIGSMWLVGFVFAGYSLPLVALIDNYLPMFIYTVLVTPLVFILNLGVYWALR